MGLLERIKRWLFSEELKRWFCEVEVDGEVFVRDPTNGTTSRYYEVVRNPATIKVQDGLGGVDYEVTHPGGGRTTHATMVDAVHAAGPTYRP